MKRRPNWPVIIPAILGLYLAVMIWLGWPSYQRGLTSPLLYFGGSALVIVLLVLLHFHLKKHAGKRGASDKSASNHNDK